jgi:cellulose synthase/poly-beta-1,6-N-acetylglucosamine synthase-like glycosyltransferase
MSEADTPDNVWRRGAAGGDDPVVSVIIPAYKAAPYIGEALESVFAQTFHDYEVVVVNDGSPDTDELEGVLKPYINRITYIKQENRGVSAARNTAVRAARAPILAFLDADDLWEPDYLAVHVEAMLSDPQLDVFYPNATTFGDSVNAGQTFMDMCPSDGEVTFEKLITLRCNVLILATLRRETFLRVGMFDESLRGSEDFDLWLRIVAAGGRIGYHRRPLARRRLRPGSLSSDTVMMHEHILKVLEKSARTMSLTPEQRALLERQQTRFAAVLKLYEGKKAFFHGDDKRAVATLNEANKFFKSAKISAVSLLLRIAPRLLLRAYEARDQYVLRTSTKF